jgi:hypothetical protein
MNYEELVIIFSTPRLERYLQASKGNKEKAVELYFQQNIFCGYFFGLTSYFEILFRNKINAFMTTHYSPDWLLKLSEPDSPLNKPNTSYTFNSLVETREKLLKDKQLTNDQMVNSLRFGFWSGLFQYKQYRDIGVEGSPSLAKPQLSLISSMNFIVS